MVHNPHTATPTPVLAPAISRGDAIGYFSPSSPATQYAPKRYARARQYLQEKGFELVTGSLTGQSDFYRSGSIHARADELNTLIRNPKVRCIMSTIGGSNSNALLPYLDYEALIADPKVIIGYSDATSILLAIHQKTGLVPFYGPALVASFGEFPPLVDATFESFASMVMARDTHTHTYTPPQFWTDEMIPWEEQDRAKSLRANDCAFFGTGTISGRLIGGNLNTMWSIWGSPFMPPIREGDILLIEDSLKPISTVERLFAFLKINGIFDRVSAVLLGKHELFDDKGSGRSPLEVLLEVLDGQELPIVNGFDSCHTHPMLTVPLGLPITIDFDQERVSIHEPWVR